MERITRKKKKICSRLKNVGEWGRRKALASDRVEGLMAPPVLAPFTQHVLGPYIMLYFLYLWELGSLEIKGSSKVK